MFSVYHLTMHPILSTSYLVPGLLLNPILFLWSMNTLLSRVLPPIIVDAAAQPAPYCPGGPSAEHPHFDIHASESLCWSYTAFIVCVNLAAFGRVSERRRAGKERARLKRECMQRYRKAGKEKLMNGNGNHLDASAALGNGFAKEQDKEGYEVGSDSTGWDAGRSDEEYPSATDSGIML